MITGGTGSLGLALTRYFIGTAERIVVFSRDEQKQAQMHARYVPKPASLRFLLGDVRDREALRHAMYGCDTVVHAAALKRVDHISCQPIEMKKTNVDGTQNVLEAALEASIKKVLLISTDKAVMPENIYGASKLMAEQLTTQFNAIGYPRGLKSSVIRYGNVWRSHGSVMDLWEDAAKAGQPLPMTDETMTRFIITLPAVCIRIEQALLNMEGGEIFVPENLRAMRLFDLAEAFGQRTHIIGLRPGGEKLHERMLSDDEPKRTYVGRHGFIVEPSHRTWTAEPSPHGVPLHNAAFRYSSDQGPFLSQETLALLIKNERPEA